MSEEKLTLGHGRGLVEIVNDAYAQMARDQIARGLIFFDKMPKPTSEQIEERERVKQEHMERVAPFMAELKKLCQKHRVALRAVGDEMDQEIEIVDLSKALTFTLARTATEDYPGPWIAL